MRVHAYEHACIQLHTKKGAARDHKPHMCRILVLSAVCVACAYLLILPYTHMHTKTCERLDICCCSSWCVTLLMHAHVYVDEHACIHTRTQTDRPITVSVCIHACTYAHAWRCRSSSSAASSFVLWSCVLLVYAFIHHMYTHTQMQTCAVGVFKWHVCPQQMRAYHVYVHAQPLAHEARWCQMSCALCVVICTTCTYTPTYARPHTYRAICSFFVLILHSVLLYALIS